MISVHAVRKQPALPNHTKKANEKFAQETPKSDERSKVDNLWRVTKLCDCTYVRRLGRRYDNFFSLGHSDRIAFVLEQIYTYEHQLVSVCKGF